MRGYDVANRLTREQRGREITRFEYDRNDNLAKLEDAQGRGIGYEYDARNRLTLTTFADSTRSERTYFGDDRVATFRDRAGNTFVYDYDDARRLSELSVKPGSDFNASTVKRTFRYDGLGRLIGAQAFGGSTNTATSQTSLGYNAVDTRLSEAQDGLALSVAQNGFGERRSIAYTDDWGVGLTIARDTRGFATSINGTGVFAGLGYSASDFLERVSFGNGAVSTRLPNSAREEQSRSLTLGDGEGALERVRAVVDRDPDGRIASITRRFQRSDRFAYTPNERWLSRAELDVVGDDVETAEAVIELDYDASGNLTRFSSAPTVIGYETNDLNQYTKVGPAELGYDTNGNLRFDGELSFSYDAFGQLTDIARNGTALAQYAYDALGRLRRRGYAGGRIEELLYDGDQLVAVRDAEGNRLRAYIYQPDAVDVPLALVTGDQTYYYELDASGSVVALVDGAGQVIERVRYDAFGRPTLTDGNAIPRDESIVGNELLFQGRPYDPVTGLYNNRARWYSARLGRFLTPDPLGPIDGVNTYAYALNDPINISDPSGTVAFVPLIVGALKLAGGGALVGGVAFAGFEFAFTGNVTKDNVTEGIVAGAITSLTGGGIAVLGARGIFGTAIASGSGRAASAFAAARILASEGVGGSLGRAAVGGPVTLGTAFTDAILGVAGEGALTALRVGGKAVFAGADAALTRIRGPRGPPLIGPRQEVILDTNAPGTGIKRFPDGSFRTPDGKFASRSGVASPGTSKARTFVQRLRDNGFDVVGEELSVRGPLGTRRFDAVIRRDGRLFGLEIKSGTATKNTFQDFTDRFINRLGAKGIGKFRGQRIEGVTAVFVP